MNGKPNKPIFDIIIITLLIITIILTSNKKPPQKYEKIGVPNYSIQGLQVYIPSYWKEEDNYHISPSNNCKIIGGVTTNSQEKMEQEIVKNELEHKARIINNIDISYGYQEDENKKVYSYFFEDYSNKYFILFINNNDSDEECDSYFEKLEHSISLDPKGEEI